MAELRLKSTGTLKLFESDNTSSVTIASPASLSANKTITLPDADVTLASGTMLATDGSGASLTSLNASELGSGTVPDARISSGSVTQHVTDLRSDIMTLALKEAITENRVAYNLPNAMIEQFQDDSKIGTETTVDRNASEYVEAVATGTDTNIKLLLDCNTTSFTDSSPNTHSMTKIGDATTNTSTKKFGAASLDLDGTGDSLSAPDHDDWNLPTTSTVELWVYATESLAGLKGIIGNGGAGGTTDYDGWNIWTSSGELKVRVRTDSSNSDTSTGQTLSEDTWYHIVWARNGTSSRVYLNGALVSTDTGAGYIAATDTDASNLLHIGQCTDGGGFLGGLIDEVRISHIDRTAAGGDLDATSGSFTPPTGAYGTTTLVTNATGTLISTAQTANAAQTKVSGVILYKNEEGTATLGTDLKIYFTCDGGSNWTESTPTAAGTFSSGILMAKCPEVTCTSGTDVRYKAVWANQSSGSKETQLHGIGMNY